MNLMRAPKTLRQALDQIQEMLSGKAYSAELWDVLVALRGPDSRDRKLKHATTAVIRSAAFPKRPCEDRSVFGKDDARYATRRKNMISKRSDNAHFREHVRDAFAALDLKLYEQNEAAWKS